MSLITAELSFPAGSDSGDSSLHIGFSAPPRARKTLLHMKQYIITVLIADGVVCTQLFFMDQRWNVHFWLQSEQIVNRPDVRQGPSPVSSGLSGAVGAAVMCCTFLLRQRKETEVTVPNPHTMV